MTGSGPTCNRFNSALEEMRDAGEIERGVTALAGVPNGGLIIARALRSIGAKQIQRIGRSEWVWRLGDSEMEYLFKNCGGKNG
jgi:hypothetical protein